MSSTDQVMSAEARGEVPPRGRLIGRKVLVVGAGQQNYGLEDPPIGNGRAVSRLAAREGAQVAIADRDEQALDETRRILTDDGATPVTVIADVSNPADVERIVREAHSGLGGLDGLVVNVGIAGGWAFDTTPDEWDLIFAVNVRAHFLACKHAAEVMPSDSSIVLVSSIAAHMPSNPLPSYHSSKAALHGLGSWLAKQLGERRIRVNLIEPGRMDTSIGRLAARADPSRNADKIPLGRQGTAWEVAYAAVFLLSGEASYITAQSLVVDGGLMALRGGYEV